MQDGMEDTNPGDVHNVTISGVDADGEENSVQFVLTDVELEAAREDARRKGASGWRMLGSNFAAGGSQESGQ